MKQLLILSLVVLVGCCPKITTTEVVTVRTDTIRDTAYIMLPVVIDSAKSEVIDINLSTLCDSLYRGQLQPQVRTSSAKRNDGSRQLIAKTEIDSLLHLIVSCHEDAYRDTLDSIRVINTMLKYEIERKQTAVIEQPVWKNFWFWLFVGLVVLTVFFAFKK